MARRKASKFKSVRAYRRLIDEATNQARRGEIPWSDVAKISQVAKAGAEMVMAENLMQANGIEDVEPEHKLGDNGGARLAPGAAAKRFQTRKTTRKTGIGKAGPIDEQSITVEGGGKNQQKEIDDLGPTG